MLGVRALLGCCVACWGPCGGEAPRAAVAAPVGGGAARGERFALPGGGEECGCQGSRALLGLCACWGLVLGSV